MIFCKIMHQMAHFLAKVMPNAYVRAFIGGAVIVILTLMLGTRDYNGAGTHMIEQSFTGTVVWYAFLVKMIFTAITIGSGYKGGEIVPTLFVGATFGCMMGPVLGLPSSLAAALSMIGTFCGVVNAPLASVFLAVEMFGTGDIILFAVVCAISYVCSGYYSLYSSQTIVQDKVCQHDIFKKAD
jgi:H+/Cl- antiporter ClcA